MNTFTNRSNCSRAAKKILGPDAKPGVDFTISDVDGKFSWTQTAHSELPTPAAKPVKAKKVKAKKVKVRKEPKPKKPGAKVITDQPQVVKLMGLMQRKDGVTVEEAAMRLSKTDKPLQPHTIRSTISRMVADGVQVNPVKDKRTTTYFLPKAEG